MCFSTPIDQYCWVVGFANSLLCYCGSKVAEYCHFVIFCYFLNLVQTSMVHTLGRHSPICSWWHMSTSSPRNPHSAMFLVSLASSSTSHENLLYVAIKLDKDAAWHCGETGVSQGLETLEDIYKSTIGKISRSVKFYHAASLVYLGWAHLSNIWM